jgi:hypothetical protein
MVLGILLVISLIGTIWFFVQDSALKSQKLSLENQTITLQAKLDKAVDEFVKLDANHQILNGKILSLENQSATLQLNLDKANTEYGVLEATYLNTSRKLNETEIVLSNLEKQLQDSQSKLTSLQGKYPPKRFIDKNALVNWLSTQSITPFSFANAVQMQVNAANDGWLVSTSISYNLNSDKFVLSNNAVLANGEVYFWFSDDHALNPYSIRE